jgi:hypothetical protein
VVLALHFDEFGFDPVRSQQAAGLARRPNRNNTIAESMQQEDRALDAVQDTPRIHLGAQIDQSTDGVSARRIPLVSLMPAPKLVVASE